MTFVSYFFIAAPEIHAFGIDDLNAVTGRHSSHWRWLLDAADSANDVEPLPRTVLVLQFFLHYQRDIALMDGN
jgi:hypothetical protein